MGEQPPPQHVDACGALPAAAPQSGREGGLLLFLHLECDDRKVPVDLSPDATVADVKAAAYSASGPEPQDQELLCGGAEVASDDDTPISETQVTNEAVVVVRLKQREKRHVGIAICGVTLAGKTALEARLQYMLGVRGSVADEPSAATFASYMRGVCTADRRTFYTPRRSWTFVNTPGSSPTELRTFLTERLRRVTQALDAMVLVVPATRRHLRNHHGRPAWARDRPGPRLYCSLLRMMCVKQIVVCVNNMNEVEYSMEHFNEAKEEMKTCLRRSASRILPADVPIIPICALAGDNVVSASDKMPWWQGQEMQVKRKVVVVKTLLDALNALQLPEGPTHAPLRALVREVRSVECSAEVAAHVLQGSVGLGDCVSVLGQRPGGEPATVVGCEVDGVQRERALPDEDVVLRVEGLHGGCAPAASAALVRLGDRSLQETASFTALLRVMAASGSVCCGDTLVCLTAAGRAKVRVTQLLWRMGRDTDGKKEATPRRLGCDEIGCAVFVAEEPLLLDCRCDPLARFIAVDKDVVVVHGKVTTTHEACAADSAMAAGPAT